MTLSGLASTHFLAASSAVILSSAMYLATRFWSALVHVKFLTRSYAGLPRVGELRAHDLVQVVQRVVAGDLRRVRVAPLVYGGRLTLTSGTSDRNHCGS